MARYPAERVLPGPIAEIAAAAASRTSAMAGLCALAGLLTAALVLAVPAPLGELPQEAVWAAGGLNAAAVALRVLTIRRLGPVMGRGAAMPPPNPDLPPEDDVETALMMLRHYVSVERAHALYRARTIAPAIGCVAFGIALNLASVPAGLAGAEAKSNLLFVLGTTAAACGLGFWAMRDWLATRGGAP